MDDQIVEQPGSQVDESGRERAGDDEMESRPQSEVTGSESLNFGSQKRSERSATLLRLDDSKGSRTQKQYEKEIFEKSRAINANLNRMPVDEINLAFNSRQTDIMTDSIRNLFDLLKDEETGRLDVTHLKAYMSHQNVQNHNPTLFKRINDMAADSNCERALTQEEFLALFLNTGLLKRDIESKVNEPPGIQEIAELFEFLDEDRTGMISGQGLMAMLELAERLKQASFEHKTFVEQRTSTSPALANNLGLMKREVDELIASFDLTGDRLISPEEFFNIIMYAYS